MTNSETAPLKATFSNKIELLNYVLMSWDLGLILLEVIRNAKSTPLPTSDNVQKEWGQKPSPQYVRKGNV